MTFAAIYLPDDVLCLFFLFLFFKVGLPIRLQGIHLLNCPPLIEVVADMAKPFVKPELLNLVGYALEKMISTVVGGGGEERMVSF